MRNWAVGRKLTALALIGLMVAVAIGVVSYISVGQIRALTDLRGQLFAADQGLRQLDLADSDLQMSEDEMLLAVHDSEAAVAQERFIDAAESVTQAGAMLQALTLPEDISAPIS